MGTTDKEVEVLYWILEDALHDGKRNRALCIFELLLYIAKYKNGLLRGGLNQTYRNRLKEIAHELHGNGPKKQIDAVTMKREIQQREIPFKSESKLQDYLIEKKSVLSEALGEQVKIMGKEIEVGDDYRCDIVAESEQTLFPIELKIAQGNHSVVSQCSKYCYYFYRKLRYSHFKKVQGIVIASGFDSWSVNAIRQEGHWIFTIIPTDDSNIRLERIH